jgi:hypothetical protein
VNSPDYGKIYSARTNIDYQRSACFFAAQGFNVLMPGPFENLIQEVDGKPLYMKMRDEFAEFEFDLQWVYLLLCGNLKHPPTLETLRSDPGMVEVEKEIQHRRAYRAKRGDAQVAMDADKIGATYYRDRVQQCLQTARQFNVPVVWYQIGEEPREVAQRLADVIE